MAESLPSEELRLAAVAESIEPPPAAAAFCLADEDPLLELPKEDDAWPPDELLRDYGGREGNLRKTSRLPSAYYGRYLQWD